MSIADRLALVAGRHLTLGSLLERLARVYPDRRLVSEAGEGGLELTYREAHELTAAWAGAIAARISPGMRVVTALPNGYAVFLVAVATARAGGVAVPVNARMRPAEIDHVIADSQAASVVRDTEELEGAAPIPCVPARFDDVAALLYTSGTTGKPKGAELSHRALVEPVRTAALYPAGLRRDEAVSAMPIAHIAGFSVAVLLAALGIPLHLLRTFRPTDALDAIESRRATLFIGVPAMYRMMVEAGASERDLSSVRLWASGADAMPVELARRFQKLGATATVPLLHRPVGEAGFVDGYGMVELGGAVAAWFSPPGVVLPLRSLVALPRLGYRLGVIDDAGSPVAHGQVGELVVKGRGVMRGYHGQRQASREILTPEGWVRTGDLARRGWLGVVELAGRKKDVIKHGGYSVFPAEVQAVLEEHPAVAEAVVVGLPDERKGALPVAVVRLEPGADLCPDELVAWAAEHLADYKSPQQVRIVSEIARNGTGKVRTEELLGLFDH